MRSFNYSKLVDRMWPTDILNLIAKIHECKGRQDMFVRQKPVELDRLWRLLKYRVRRRPTILRALLPPVSHETAL